MQMIFKLSRSMGCYEWKYPIKRMAYSFDNCEEIYSNIKLMWGNLLKS